MKKNKILLFILLFALAILAGILISYNKRNIEFDNPQNMNINSGDSENNNLNIDLDNNLNENEIIDSNQTKYSSKGRILESFIDISDSEYLDLNMTDIYEIIPNNVEELKYYFLGKIILNGSELDVIYYKEGLKAELIFFLDGKEKGNIYVGELDGPSYGDIEWEEKHKGLPLRRASNISIFKEKYLIILEIDAPGNSLTHFNILNSDFEILKTLSTDNCYWKNENASDINMTKIFDDKIVYSNNEIENEVYVRKVYELIEDNGIFESKLIEVDANNVLGPAGQS